METVQLGEFPSIISDKCGTTGGRQSLRVLQVSMDDEEYLLVDSIKRSRYIEDEEDKKQKSSSRRE